MMSIRNWRAEIAPACVARAPMRLLAWKTAHRRARYTWGVAAIHPTRKRAREARTGSWRHHGRDLPDHPGLAEWGVDRWTKQIVLDELEGAGLIRKEGRAGKAPVVTIMVR